MFWQVSCLSPFIQFEIRVTFSMELLCLFLNGLILDKFNLSKWLKKIIDKLRFSCWHQRCLEAVTQRCSVKEVFLEISQNSQENTCARVSFWIKFFNFIKKETLAQVFSCEFYEISKNNFFHRTPLVAAPKICKKFLCRLFRDVEWLTDN